LRIRIGEQPGDAGTAWTHACAAREGPAWLDFTPWSAWLLGDQISPLFVRPEMAAELRSEPAASTAIATISGDHALEPLEISGEWMRVRLREPSDYCRPEVVSTAREGWVRWFSPEAGPRVWYFARGC
jgi:hypothetical protein